MSDAVMATQSADPALAKAEDGEATEGTTMPAKDQVGNATTTGDGAAAAAAAPGEEEPAADAAGRATQTPSSDNTPRAIDAAAGDVAGGVKAVAGAADATGVDIALQRERDAAAMSAADLLLTPTAVTRPAVKSATTHALRVELGSDGLTEALLGPLSGRSTASSRARRSRHRLGPIKHGTKSYLATSIVPLLIEGLTQMSIVRPVASLSTMGPSAWLAQFILERSPQRAQYEIRLKDAGVHIRTQTQFDPEFPPLPRQVEAEVQTRLKGRDVEAAATAAGSGVAAIRSKQGGSGGGALGPGLIVQLKELSELVQMGILTQTEFLAAKSLLFQDAGMDIAQPSRNVVTLHQQQPVSFASGPLPLPQPRPRYLVRNTAVQGFESAPVLDAGLPDTAGIVADAEAGLPENNKTATSDFSEITQAANVEEATTDDTPPTPATESEDIDSMLRPVFIALDKKGSGALSALDMLHEIPRVSASPAFQRAAQSLPCLQKLAHPGSFRNEVQTMIGLGREDDKEQLVDLDRFSSWARQQHESDASPGSSLTNVEEKGETEETEETGGAREQTQEQNDQAKFGERVRGEGETEVPMPISVEQTENAAVDSAVAPEETGEVGDGAVVVETAEKEDAASTTNERIEVVATTAQEPEEAAPTDPLAEQVDLPMQEEKAEQEDDLLFKEEEAAQPADPASQQRLAFRSKRRLLRDRALRSLFDAFDVGDTGMLEKSEILRALVSNQRVTGLLAYHAELERLAHPKSFGAMFKRLDTDSDGTVSWTEFKAFCTAVLSDNEGDNDDEGEAKHARILKRAALEKTQHLALKKVFDMLLSSEDEKESAVGKGALCRAIEKRGNDVRAFVVETQSISYMRFVKRYEQSLVSFPVAKEGYLSCSELTAFVGSMTQETLDDEGILFGEPRAAGEGNGEEDDDY